GMVPGGGQTQRLPRLVGTSKAKELLFTCDPLSAKEAERIGVVNKVVPSEAVQDEARKMAKKILRNVPETVATIKALINQSAKLDLESGLKLEENYHDDRPISPSEEGGRRIKALLGKSRE
ncbi:MAG: enoyl-CoA hydratase, partial [Proteobacteria bacterium]|nr:enoyl-CoA hydratase [Pseudomonadota bacterium]